MKQLVIDCPDHVPETALIDFISKSCHYYHSHLRLENGDQEWNYYDELLNIINDFEWSNDAMDSTIKAHQQWQLNDRPWKFNSEPEWE